MKESPSAQRLELSACAVYVVERDTMRFVFCNDAATHLSGRPFDLLRDTDPWTVFTTTREELESTYDRLIRSEGMPERVESRWQVRRGRPRRVEMQHHAQRTGDRWHIVTTAHDLTHDDSPRAALRRLTRLYAVVSGVNSLVLRTQDRQSLYGAACSVAVQQGEFTSAWIGILSDDERVTPVASAGLDERALAAIKDAFDVQSAASTQTTLVARAIRLRAPVISNDVQSDQAALFSREYIEAGVRALGVFPLVIGSRPVGVLALRSNRKEFFDAQGVQLLAEVADNIAYAIDHIERQELLDYRAYYQELTGLANRRLFIERLAQYLRVADDSGTTAAVFHIDLERFRAVNNSLGRAAGDSLLQQVAKWLENNLDNRNDVAHFGGDHFAVVVPRVDDEEALVRLVEGTMRDFLAYPFALEGQTYRVAAKIGAAIYPEDGGDADTLLLHAEAALKKAKAGGEPYLFYAKRMSQTIIAALDLENRLRQAVDRAEFVLYYQPKFDLDSNQVVGAEALLRWNSPTLGLVPPDTFIPVLERTGLIQDVGRWTVQAASTQYAEWLDLGLPAVPIAVNVSPLQLRHPHFRSAMLQVIESRAHAKNGLDIEITESVLMEDTVTVIETLALIRAHGVAISIDDFGTGFSSLSQLSRLPIDALKIDRSFIRDLDSGERAMHLVSAIINLAHSLGLKVIAEGVETERQLDILHELRCNEIQGYLRGRPVPSTEFQARFLTRTPSRHPH